MPKIHIGESGSGRYRYELNTLTQHAAVIGASGSGKTVMCKVLVEEALMAGIPVIAIDPKGDIPGLAIVDKGYDFRPFISTKKKAEKTAGDYLANISSQQADGSGIARLKAVRTTVYTPKSNVGKPVSLIPDLSAPRNFSRLTSENPALVADFVEPISSSILQLAGIGSSQKDRFQSFVSQLLLHNWNAQQDLTIERLIAQVLDPPFDRIGTLPLEDFIKASEAKKLAASINLLVSSPSRRAWSHGERLDMDKLFEKGTLTVFDLRFCQSTADKQFVAEEIMQKIYKYLLNKGGSQKLRYLLYFDELAGFLPPPPASPPSKKLLELLIRQARAFGLGIIVATQNPGDIDYKILGNIGTRFIGKLRTDNDIDKVASAADMPSSSLKTKLSRLRTGDFIVNDSVKNTTALMHSRWLFSYHKGPLQDHEIGWINDPASMPDEKDPIRPKKAKVRTIVLPSSRGREESAPEPKPQPGDNQKELKAILDRKTTDQLRDIRAKIKRYSDQFHMRFILSESTHYHPYMKVVIEPKPFRGVEFSLRGPYYFDLTREMIPELKSFKSSMVSRFARLGITVDRPRRGTIRKGIEYARADAKSLLKTQIYESTISDFASKDKDKVEKSNHSYIKPYLDQKLAQLDRSLASHKRSRKRWIYENNSKILELNMKVSRVTAKNMLNRMIRRPQALLSEKQLSHWKARIGSLAKENALHMKDIQRFQAHIKERKSFYRRKAFERAVSSIKATRYSPKNSDIIVHAYLILAPKDQGLSKQQLKLAEAQKKRSPIKSG